MGHDRHKFRCILSVLLALTIGISPLAGCMGHMGLTQKVKKVNLRTVENRWGREGIFLGFHIFWVYRISGLVDLLVLNSIEFWSGENPVTNQPALVNIPKEVLEQIFEKESIDLGQIQRINDRQAKMLLAFRNGDRMTFDIVRIDDIYTVSYRGREFYTGMIN